MGIEDYKGQEKMLLHRESILAAEAARLAGAPTFTQEDMDSQVEKLLNSCDNEASYDHASFNGRGSEGMGLNRTERLGF